VDTSVNRVYRIGADGSADTLINDNANLTLEGVKAGKLLLSATFASQKSIYAISVTSQTVNGDIKIADPQNSKNPHEYSFRYVICASDFDTLTYIEEDDGSLAVIYLQGNNLTYAKYAGNTAPSVTYTIHRFSSTPTINFVGTFKDSYDDNNGYLVFINKVNSKQHVYKIRYTFASEAECQALKEDPEQLTTSNVRVEETSSSSETAFKLGNLVPEIVGNYVYVFVNDEDSNVLMHRVNLYTPKELNEQNPPVEEPGEGEEEEEETKEDLEVKEAELVGGPEI
jgi:hypothetical protein